jgi:hypothetical protein
MLSKRLAEEMMTGSGILSMTAVRKTKRQNPNPRCDANGWVWFGIPISASECQLLRTSDGVPVVPSFALSTMVGDYLVSTLGIFTTPPPVSLNALPSMLTNENELMTIVVKVEKMEYCSNCDMMECVIDTAKSPVEVVIHTDHYQAMAGHINACEKFSTLKQNGE